MENKEEAAKFISEVLGTDYQITEKDIEKYNSSFISNKFKNQEADVIYRLKNRNVFFLIEHQTKIDYMMPLRILEYEYAIMKSAIDSNQMGRKDYKLPMVVSTVLYTGKRKWNAQKHIKEAQERIEGYDRAEFAKYSVVDVNDFSEEELLKKKSFLSKAMLIEKAKSTDRLEEYLRKTIEEMDKDKRTYKEEQRELLRIAIDLILRKSLGQKVSDDLIEKLKGGKETMLAVLEMIDREKKTARRQGRKQGLEEGRRKGIREGIRKGLEEGREEGRKEGIVETAKRMLVQHIDVQTILAVTGLTQEEIENIK